MAWSDLPARFEDGKRSAVDVLEKVRSIRRLVGAGHDQVVIPIFVIIEKCSLCRITGIIQAIRCCLVFKCSILLINE